MSFSGINLTYFFIFIFFLIRYARKHERLNSQKTLLTMLYDNYNQFLERSRERNRSSVRTKANKTEDQFHQANIHDCEDMLSYLKKNLLSTSRYRRPKFKERVLKSQSSIVDISHIKRRRKSTITYDGTTDIIECYFKEDLYYISSSESENDNDDLYLPFNKVKHEQKRKVLSNKKTTNSEKRRIMRELSEVYSKMPNNVQYNDIINKKDPTYVGSKAEKLQRNFAWVMELKHIDSKNGLARQYNNNLLIILRNFNKKLLRLTLDQFSKSKLQEVVDCSTCHVQITQRCCNGQMYVAQGLQNSVHFTLSTASTKIMTDILTKNKISSTTISDKETLCSDSSFLSFYEFDGNKHHLFEKNVNSYMKTIGNNGLWKHFKNNFDTTSQQRAKYVVNLGVTGLKCDCYKQVSITGKIVPDLISKETRTYVHDEVMISTIGKLLMYIGDKILPTLSDQVVKAFMCEDEYEQEYIDKFSDSLNIERQCSNNKLRFPAMSLLINQDLNPHCDKLNPRVDYRDYTIVITSMISLVDIDLEYRDYLRDAFGDLIPLCIVLYNRQCLLNYSCYWKTVNRFISSKPLEESGRRSMVQLLHSVNTDADYLSNFFQKKCHEVLESNFKFDKLCKGFKHKIYTTNEAVDKIGWWSSLLHMYLVYSWSFDLKTEDVLSLILFFSHQCTTTTTIVGALEHIIVHKTSRLYNDNPTLYTRLVIICNELNGTPERTSDTGSGRHPRFQTSDSTIYSDNEVIVMISIMNKIFAHYSSKMNEVNHTDQEQANFKKKFILYSMLLSEFDNPSQTKLHVQYKNEPFLFKGLSTIRINHMIAFASLVGVLPIDYYVCTPVHSSGGVGSFLANIVPKCKTSHSNELIEWNTNMINELQNVFSIKMTPNMLENLLCIIARKRSRLDIYYFLPHVNNVTNDIIIGERIQLFFRINPNKKGRWSLEVFNGKEVSTFLSSEYPILNRVSYLRNSDGLLSTVEPHTVD